MKKLSLVFGMVLMSVSFLLAQRTITGKITDADTGEGLISASVLVEGTARGTVTDATGNYSIDMPQGSTVLVFSYTGYSTQKVTVGAENVINIQLAEGVTMNNVVITALGLEEDRDKSAKSSTQVGGDLIKNSGETGVLQGIAGKSSGVIVTRSSGDPGAGAVSKDGYAPKALSVNYMHRKDIAKKIKNETNRNTAAGAVAAGTLGAVGMQTTLGVFGMTSTATVAMASANSPSLVCTSTNPSGISCR